MILSFAFLACICLCGIYDLRDRQIPLWTMVLAGITGFGMWHAHPVFSVLSGVTFLIFCMFYKMGTADRILFPIAAAALGAYGVLFAAIALSVSIWHSRAVASPAPAVTYLAVVSALVLIIGGIL
ncbi:hypothetical protein ACFSR7_05740 [Cohnella sp. GCM10020058]|uniref:hypothetical protein n=1 Tax=Cohnella sp. GCM10020058 TaxID=3317330 RepID=UPI00362D0B6C